MTQLIFLVLLVGSFGAFAAPETYHPIESMEMVLSPLPYTNNLDEKAIPLSKLLVDNYFLLPGGQNLLERSQLPGKPPAINNLSEKRIPESVLQKLARPPGEINQDS